MLKYLEKRVFFFVNYSGTFLFEYFWVELKLFEKKVGVDSILNDVKFERCTKVMLENFSEN